MAVSHPWACTVPLRGGGAAASGGPRQDRDEKCNGGGAPADSTGARRLLWRWALAGQSVQTADLPQVGLGRGQLLLRLRHLLLLPLDLAAQLLVLRLLLLQLPPGLLTGLVSCSHLLHGGFVLGLCRRSPGTGLLQSSLLWCHIQRLLHLNLWQGVGALLLESLLLLPQLVHQGPGILELLQAILVRVPLLCKGIFRFLGLLLQILHLLLVRLLLLLFLGPSLRLPLRLRLLG